MGIPSKLPPELQEVEADLQAALRKGDRKACQELLNSLAVEAEAGRIIVDQTDLLLIEIDEQIDTFPEIAATAKERIKELTDLQLAGRVMMARHAYAIYWLYRINHT